MNSEAQGTDARPYWFVGAAFGGTRDQTERFVKEGIWENGHKDKYLDLVKSIRAGDRIAIKSSYTRKRGLPFDNRGHPVSVMAIKAIGTVKENPGDGRLLKVDWKPVDPPREWYFFTNQKTVWQVLPGDWKTDALIAFTFEGKPQDIDRFRNAPPWRERFGDHVENRFKWTRFYEAVADKLLEFKGRREELNSGILTILKNVDLMPTLREKLEDGSIKYLDPFTIMGLFNRQITGDKRKTIAAELAALLGVTEEIPESFDNLPIPILYGQKSLFFALENKRNPGDIDALWEVFTRALALAESDNEDTRSAFILAFDDAMARPYVSWNLTMGLFWSRPWKFLPLDKHSQNYITEKLEIKNHRFKSPFPGSEYLELMDTLEARFQEENYPVHSFPELSLEAWLYTKEISTPPTGKKGPEPPQPKSYSIDDIIKDGCFLPKERLEKIFESLETKKNLILQGPPGTGKTWLSKRLAYALIGERDESKVRAVQFHPNLSYEDFIRGWRPAGDGRLQLVDGPFMQMVNAAKKDPEKKYVLVIEEINRGNPAQIFGEMLTLLEADKRTPEAALELSYKRSEEERVFIPENLFVIGTMNIADRSLALVDLALRRRFAFIDLEPAFGEPWRKWVHSKCGIDRAFLKEIEERIKELNKKISNDPSLGPQFQVGHSYVTPSDSIRISDAREWFCQVVKTEIGPLLDELWFDNGEKAREAKKRLLEGIDNESL